MPIVVGVTLRTAGKQYYFDPGTVRYERGERVLVETARGLELGEIKLPPHEVTEQQIVTPLKSVVRRASTADMGRDLLNREREARALEVCKRLVTKLNLPMRLIDAQYTFDGSHVLIHFLADNRVDFRELVRELAHDLHTRIELRQVGVRDEAKLLGGYGMCGRSLCCTTFLSNFIPVAINVAKEQGLALNPQKISGMCGRLMCCLAYEYESYKAINSELPRVNTMVETPRGTGKVTKLNVLARQVEVTIPELPAPVWLSVDELTPFGQPARCTAAHAECCCAMHAAEAPVAEASPVEAAAEVDESEETTEADGAPRRRRPRRRRRKNIAAAPDAAGAAPAPAPAGEAAEPARPRRARPRKRRQGKGGEAVPAGTPGAPTPVSAGPPPGRYRPNHRPPTAPSGDA